MFIALIASIVIVTVFVIIFLVIYFPKSKNAILLNACNDGDYAAAAAVVKKGADDWAGLAVAAGRGHTEIVTLLLDGEGATPSLMDESLANAALTGHADIIKLLLERGANPNAKDRNNRSALTHARFRGHTSVVDLLIEHGAQDDHNDDGINDKITTD